jgi:Spy/CpxP family protein refolding chaperone
MKRPILIVATLLTAALAVSAFAEDPKAKGPPPGGAGGPSQESPEMKALLESFHLTPEQRAKYDAAKAETGKQMRAIHEGKVSGSLTKDEVLKQALASHKAFNAAVKEILTSEQYEKWEPLREADHHKIAQAHKERDAAGTAAKGADTPPKP